MRTRLMAAFHGSAIFLLVLACGTLGQTVSGQAPRSGGRVSPVPRITAANATGDAAEVLALEQKIEAAVVRGDVAVTFGLARADGHLPPGAGFSALNASAPGHRPLEREIHECRSFEAQL